jgi:hypothetical protein
MNFTSTSTEVISHPQVLQYDPYISYTEVTVSSAEAKSHPQVLYISSQRLLIIHRGYLFTDATYPQRLQDDPYISTTETKSHTQSGTGTISFAEATSHPQRLI